MPTSSEKRALIIRRRAFLKQLGKRLPPIKKKPLKQVPPKTIQLSYFSSILKLLNPMFSAIKEDLVPKISDIIEIYKDDIRTDSEVMRKDQFSELITKIFAGIRTTATFGLKEGTLIELTSSMANQTAGFNGRQFDRVFKSILGVNPILTENWLEPKIVAFTEKNIQLIKSIPDEYLNSLESMVRRTVEQGITSGDLKKQILNDLKFKPSEKIRTKAGKDIVRKINPRTRAKLIARDQIQKFNAELNDLRQKEAGVTHYRWRNTFSGSPYKREEHSAREGNIYKHGELADEPGVEPNCLPGYIEITVFSEIEKLFRRKYIGELTEIISSSGISMNATPNHPILTNRGWIAAKNINIGDYVFDTSINRSGILKRNPKNMYASIEQIFNFFSRFFKLQRIAGITSQFHGDGIINEDVDIISLDSSLLNDIEIIFTKDICQEILTKTQVALSNLSSCSLFDFCFNSIFASYSSDISFMGKIFSIFFRKHIDSETMCLTLISKLDIIFKEASSNCPSVYTILFGDSKLTHPSKIIDYNAFFIKFFFIISRAINITPSIDIPSSKMFAKIVRIDGKDNTYLGKPQPFIKHYFRVIKKITSEFSGHVYNLQTKKGWYCANNYITKNCNCWKEPVLDEFKERE